MINFHDPRAGELRTTRVCKDFDGHKVNGRFTPEILSTMHAGGPGLQQQK